MARRNLPSPFSPHRIRGCSILFSLYTISGDFFPLGQTLPLGDFESASTLTSLPCSRVATISHLLWHIPHTPLFSIPITPLFYTRNVSLASFTARLISALITISISSPISRAYWSNSFSVQKKFMAFQHDPAQLEISSRQKESAYKPFGQCFTHSPPFISKRTSFPHTQQDE